ncbi:hypothetical protein [Couchioplanes caeruleus]|uniref:Uncharacterized protein n=1 Tax=Couchioplanes caeruleus TaxID=56438 RepID=A0A3N1GF00_9ACTN|nr:hypothetical protein [Couchioplanes caeruleus]ROP28758.1 hypothetical protein EDD30_1530 [Couchioplanes caeruleus]
MTYRLATAWGVLRGRSSRPDYGMLLVLPFLAAAGGALLALAVESAVGARRTRE